MQPTEVRTGRRAGSVSTIIDPRYGFKERIRPAPQAGRAEKEGPAGRGGSRTIGGISMAAEGRMLERTALIVFGQGLRLHVDGA